MAESPKRTSDSLAIPEADLGPASQKAKTSDDADKGEVVDLSSDDAASDAHTDGERCCDACDTIHAFPVQKSSDNTGDADRDAAELPPGLPDANPRRGPRPGFFVDYALCMQTTCNRMSDVMRPLFRSSLGNLSAADRRKQRAVMESIREQLKALVVFTDAEIGIFDKYESE